MESQNRMTKEEFSKMVSLLSKYIDNEMDQHEQWKLNSRFGEAYINISLYAEADIAAYTDISELIKK